MAQHDPKLENFPTYFVCRQLRSALICAQPTPAINATLQYFYRSREKIALLVDSVYLTVDTPLRRQVFFKMFGHISACRDPKMIIYDHDP